MNRARFADASNINRLDQVSERRRERPTICGVNVTSRQKQERIPMAQTQAQKQGGQQGSGANNPEQQGDRADQRRQQGGGELPKQQNQDPSRRGGPQNDQQDDPKNNQR
jgi:hypothetical protein